MKILIIIPAYNEAKNLPILIQKLKYLKYDVLVVNDCSVDDTRNICKACHINVINLSVNLGIGGAVQTGYKYAYYNNYDIAIQVDGDGQHNPEYITSLIEKLNNGSDLCIGSRFIDNSGFQSTLIRRFGIKYFCNLIKLVCGQKITDPTSGFRACNKKVIEIFANEYPKDYPEPETIVFLKKRKLKINEVAVKMNDRKEGKSSINTLKSIYYMIKVTFAIIITALKR